MIKRKHKNTEQHTEPMVLVKQSEFNELLGKIIALEISLGVIKHLNEAWLPKRADHV